MKHSPGDFFGVGALKFGSTSSTGQSCYLLEKTVEGQGKISLNITVFPTGSLVLGGSGPVTRSDSGAILNRHLGCCLEDHPI